MESQKIDFEKLVLNNIDEYTVIANTEFQILFINKAGPGLSKENMIGSYLPDMIDPVQRKDYIQFLKDIVDSGEPNYYTYNSQGGLYLRVYGNLIKGFDGEDLLLLVNSNLTKFIQRYTQDTDDKIYSYRVDTAILLVDETTTILSSSKEILELIGSKESIEGKLFTDLIQSPTISPQITQIEQNNIYQLKRMDDKEPINVRVEVRKTTLNTNNYWLLNVIPRQNLHPISTKNKDFSDLLHIQKLQSLGMLSGKIAHDFNNILTAIYGSLALLESKTDQKELLQEIDKIKRITRNSKELPLELIGYSREVDEDKVELITPSTELNEMKVLIELFGKNHQLSIINKEMDGPILMNSIHYKQLILNLLSNAIEATTPNEGIEILSKNVDNLPKQNIVYSMKNDSNGMGYYMIKVEDRGSGISDEIKARMFEPYFSTKSSGRGLGLSIIMDIVQRYNGIIEVDVAHPKGTSISIYFPLYVD